jgi:hypothetical protein
LIAMRVHRFDEWEKHEACGGRSDCRPERWPAYVRWFAGSFVSAQLPALTRFLVVALRWTVTPFAGVRIVARVVLLALFSARFVGAAEFGATVAHGTG